MTLRKQKDSHKSGTRPSPFPARAVAGSRASRYDPGNGHRQLLSLLVDYDMAVIIAPNLHDISMTFPSTPE